MSQDAFARIEKSLASLTAEVTSLRECVEVLHGKETPLGARQICEFLDAFRAGEALGEAALGAWIATCRVECLKGGLRVAQLREGSHARLLEARLKELGGSPRYELPESVHETFFAVLASAEKTDAEKLACFFAQVDVDQTLRQLGERADRMARDPETQALLRAIIDDERATLCLLQSAREQLGG